MIEQPLRDVIAVVSIVNLALLIFIVIVMERSNK